VLGGAPPWGGQWRGCTATPARTRFALRSLPHHACIKTWDGCHRTPRLSATRTSLVNWVASQHNPFEARENSILVNIMAYFVEVEDIMWYFEIPSSLTYQGKYFYWGPGFRGRVMWGLIRTVARVTWYIMVDLARLGALSHSTINQPWKLDGSSRARDAHDLLIWASYRPNPVYTDTYWRNHGP